MKKIVLPAVLALAIAGLLAGLPIAKANATATITATAVSSPTAAAAKPHGADDSHGVHITINAGTDAPGDAESDKDSDADSKHSKDGEGHDNAVMIEKTVR